MPTTEILLTKQDLAARWQVCERTVRRLVLRLNLPRLILTRRTVRFRLGDVLRVEPGLSRLVHIQPSGAVAEASHARRAEHPASASRAGCRLDSATGTDPATASRA